MREIVPRRMIPEYSSTLELGRTIFEPGIILALFVPTAGSSGWSVSTVEAEFCWSTGGDLWATHINICKLMGITYIVYCSGHFSRKAVSIFLLSSAFISVKEKCTWGSSIDPIYPGSLFLISIKHLYSLVKQCCLNTSYKYSIYWMLCILSALMNGTSVGHQLGQLALEYVNFFPAKYIHVSRYRTTQTTYVGDLKSFELAKWEQVDNSHLHTSWVG